MSPSLAHDFLLDCRLSTPARSTPKANASSCAGKRTLISGVDSALKRAPMATVESAFAISYLRQRYPRLLVHQVEHAPNPVFQRVKRWPQVEPVRFVNIGTVCPRKGTDLLLRALDQLVPEFPFELTIVGSPAAPLVADLKAQLSPELWRRITFKTDLAPGEIAAELATATISVLPTRADTSPNAVKESVVAGVPVVAARVGGIPDYVSPGQNGLLFPSEDLAQCVRALRKAVQHPLFGQGRVEPSSLRRSREYLSPRRMAEGFLSAYQLALAKHRPQPSQALWRNSP